MSALDVRPWKGNTPGADPRRCALVLPGRAYPVEMPGLTLPLRALALAGWTVWHAAWDLDDLDDSGCEATVQEAVTRLDEATSGARTRLILGKSLGSLAAPWAAEHAVPAVWLTPLLDVDGFAEAVARSSAPTLLAAGTRDFAWDDEAAARSGARLLRLEGVDHGLHAQDWRGDLTVLAELTQAVESFAREVAGRSG